MTHLNIGRSFMRAIFFSTYAIASFVLIGYLILELLSGSNSILVFLRNDLLSSNTLLLFVFGLPISFLFSLFLLLQVVRLPCFDYFMRILILNLFVFGFYGLILTGLRIDLYSRTAVLSAFLLATVLLVIFYQLRNKLFPKLLGVLTHRDLQLFSGIKNLRFALLSDPSEINRGDLDGVVFDLRRERTNDESVFLAEFANKQITIYDSSTLLESLSGRIPLVSLTTAEIKNLAPPRFYSRLKRIFDVFFVILVFPLLIPIIVLICIAIKIDSRGPIIFQQQRIGLYRLSFSMYKFRSMREQPNTTDTTFSEKGDKRITTIGKILRRFRLDELPQIWNVLRGEMSLIGPRPEQPTFASRYDRLIPYYGFRHTVRPGITGLAQVLFEYAASDEQTKEKLEYDFFYIKHMSIWLDFVVLVKTIRTILFGTGFR